jgi:putative effector of murein hydrolase
LGESSFEGDERARRLVENNPSGIHGTQYWHSLRYWAFHNPVLLLCWLFTFTLGLPLRYRAGSDVVLATLLLLSVWLTTLAIQTSIKHNPRPAPWLQTLLSGLFNAVLWTSLAIIAYIFADSAISKRPLPVMLDALQSHTPLSTLIVRAASAPPPTPGTSTSTGSDTPRLAAGDIAISILNSGLVAWGFKLYEYRLQLLSRGGLTVCTVSAVLALANTVCGPLFARHVLGVTPASHSLAFAARSVTIALANPVMAMLDGDARLNAAMVVGSGIVYQMGLGFGAGRWLEARVCGWVVRRWRLRPRDVDSRGPPTTTDVTAGEEGRVDDGAGDAARGGQATQDRHRANDPRVVAAGVTVGINAAAMGTAYLYETQNEAAPHAALSMIALGIMTVVFSSITPLAHWIVGTTST